MIGIVDYGLGNLASVAGAVEILGFEPCVTRDPDVLARADKLILPGVGAFGDGMRNLRERGLVAPLTDLVCRKGVPILGLCLGFQLLPRRGDEFGHHEGLAGFPRACANWRQDHGACRMWDGMSSRRSVIAFSCATFSPTASSTTFLICA